MMKLLKGYVWVLIMHIFIVVRVFLFLPLNEYWPVLLNAYNTYYIALSR